MFKKSVFKKARSNNGKGDQNGRCAPFLALLILLSITCIPLVSADEPVTTVGMTLSNEPSAVGETFNATIWIDCKDDIDGFYIFNLDWSPDILDVVEINCGWWGWLWDQGSINENSITKVQAAQKYKTNENQTACTITFNVTGHGECDFTELDIEVISGGPAAEHQLAAMPSIFIPGSDDETPSPDDPPSDPPSDSNTQEPADNESVLPVENENDTPLDDINNTDTSEQPENSSQNDYKITVVPPGQTNVGNTTDGSNKKSPLLQDGNYPLFFLGIGSICLLGFSSFFIVKRRRGRTNISFQKNKADEVVAVQQITNTDYPIRLNNDFDGLDGIGEKLSSEDENIGDIL